MKKIIPYGVSFLLVSCATHPDDLLSQSVSTLNYKGYNCEELETEYIRLTNRKVELYQALKRNHSTDIVKGTIGTLLFVPVWLLLDGDGPESAEFSRVSGEAEAVYKRSTIQGCEIELRDLKPIIEKIDKKKKEDAQKSAYDVDNIDDI